MLNRPLPAPARDIALLIGRIVLGVVLFAHGWQKLMINGIAGTYGQFEKLGIPLAIVSASFTSFVEFVGGAMLIVGALTTTVIALDLVVMVGAAGFVHLTHGVFAQNGGWELVGVIVAAELALAATGPGRFSVDHMLLSRRSRESLPPVPVAPLPAPVPDGAAFGPAADRAPQRMGVAAQFTRLSPLDTGPIAIDTRQPERFTPRTAPQPTPTQQAAIAKVAGRPEVGANTERPVQVPPAAPPVTVADLVGARPAVELSLGEMPHPAAAPVAAATSAPAGTPVRFDTSARLDVPARVETTAGTPVDGPGAPVVPTAPVTAAPLFEPHRPLVDAQPAFGPRRAAHAPRPFVAQVPVVQAPPTVQVTDQAPTTDQRAGELPQRVRRTERVGRVVTPHQ